MPYIRTAIALLASGLTGVAVADFSDDPDNPSDFDISPGLTLLSIELEDTNLADWVRFTVEPGETVTSLFNFESFFFHNEQVTMRLDQYVEILPGFEMPVLLGEIQLDQFTGATDDLLWDLAGGHLLAGDYRLGLTQTTTGYSDMRFVFRTVPGPASLGVLATAAVLGTRRRR